MNKFDTVNMKKKKPSLENFNFEDFEQEAVKRLLDGEELTGKEGVLTPLVKKILERALEAELAQHLDDADATSGFNRRNGRLKKQMKSGHGPFELETPRDRSGTFEPEIVKKRQTILGTSLENKIISLYALGMSYNDIRDHIEDMYGIEMSQGMLNQITDKIIPEIHEWQSRPLDEVYPFLWLDAIHFKVREDGKVQSKAVYTIIGLNMHGIKDLLGIYLSESEGAKFWLQVLTDLSNRGVKDVLIASIDNLKGFSEAIQTVFSNTEVQLCIVHQIRNSLKYLPWKDQKSFLKDLKKVYQANTKESAEQNLKELDNKWGKKYPIVLDSWKKNWQELSNYFKYPSEIRRIIYTTNIIEGYHRQIRKVTKTKGAFASENALLKIIYLASMRVMEKWKTPVWNWNVTLQKLVIIFGDRIKLDLN
jgi:transposase-like protein